MKAYDWLVQRTWLPTSSLISRHSKLVSEKASVQITRSLPGRCTRSNSTAIVSTDIDFASTQDCLDDLSSQLTSFRAIELKLELHSHSSVSS
jgi:hypothetical protein